MDLRSGINLAVARGVWLKGSAGSEWHRRGEVEDSCSGLAAEQLRGCVAPHALHAPWQCCRRASVPSRAKMRAQAQGFTHPPAALQVLKSRAKMISTTEEIAQVSRESPPRLGSG